jgi:uncharacterized protein (DUF488 family)
MTVRRLVTIGYEGATVEAFLRTLTAAGVTSLLDIREFAGSRRKGFAKTALRENLAKVGINYRHEPALGSPREIRHRVRNDGRYGQFFLEFERYLGGQEPLLQQLTLELSGVVSLLCYEQDYRACHRQSVAAALSRILGLPPEHLRAEPSGHSELNTPGPRTDAPSQLPRNST